MSGPDVEAVLAAHERHTEQRVNAADPSLRDIGATCSCGKWNAFDNGGHYRAHVAAVLREQLATAQAEAWDEAVQALGWALNNGPADSALPHVAEHNPYRAEERL